MHTLQRVSILLCCYLQTNLEPWKHFWKYSKTSRLSTVSLLCML